MTDNQSKVVLDLESAAKSLREFYGDKPLTRRIAELQSGVNDAGGDQIMRLLADQAIGESVLNSALQLKAVAGQINVVIHAVGIMLALPHILDAGEIVEYVSLGAGNSGKAFDLKTDKRVAEFKFINWQGGAEAIRQNQLFKDFFYLAEYEGDKRRCLYVLDTKHPLRFFNGRRAMSSVLSRNKKLADDFQASYGDQYRVVSDYYNAFRDRVEITSIGSLFPCFSSMAILDDIDVDEPDQLIQPQAHINGDYYFYENWVAKGHTAIIHRSTCSHCNNGQGRTGKVSTRNGAWSGAYTAVADAKLVAEAKGADVSLCSFCIRVD